MPPRTTVPATGARGQACPIVPDLLDGTAARLAAGLSLALMALFAWQGWGLAALALGADFALRGLGHQDLSPVARLAGLLRRAAGLPARRINAGPKRFAAQVGSLFSLGVGLALLAGLRPLGLGLASVLGLCAGLEAFLGFCVACQIHPWLPWNRSA